MERKRQRAGATQDKSEDITGRSGRLDRIVRHLWAAGELSVELPEDHFELARRRANETRLPAETERRLQRGALRIHRKVSLQEAVARLRPHSLGLGALLLASRQEAELTIRQAAEALGIDRSLLAAIEGCRISFIKQPISRIVDLLLRTKLDFSFAIEAIRRHEAILEDRLETGAAIPRSEDTDAIEIALQDLLTVTKSPEAVPKLPREFVRALRAEMERRAR